MFTGIVEEIGSVFRVENTPDAARITVHGPKTMTGIRRGDSIAVSGVCLTAVEYDSQTFTADVMAQTLRMSTLSNVKAGDRVNLERAARIGDPIGGHLVQGHIDGTASVLTIRPGQNWQVVRFALETALAPLVVDKGSIAIDGVSLTISDISQIAHSEQYWFEVSLIPETLAATTLGQLQVGDTVNLETDIIARQLQRMMQFVGTGLPTLDRRSGSNS